MITYTARIAYTFCHYQIKSTIETRSTRRPTDLFKKKKSFCQSEIRKRN